MPETVYLALGGNLGDVATTFDRAAAALERGGLKILQKSRNYRTAPVGCAPGTPDFLNAVWRCSYGGTPEELLALCQSIEVAEGRPRAHGINQSRTLDLDIIEFGVRRIVSERLTVPHPRAEERDFVRLPLAEVRLSGGASRRD